MWFWLLSTVAGAREYHLDPAVTGIDLDGLLTVAASEIDWTATDYVITMELRNDGPSTLDLLDLQCTRGKFVMPVHGERGQRIEILPGESRSLQLLCDHGRSATGDPSLRISEVQASPEGGGTSTVFKNVVWRMKEADLTSERIHAGVQLATGAFDRPTRRAVAPVLLTEDAPLAIPAGTASETGVASEAVVAPAEPPAAPVAVPAAPPVAPTPKAAPAKPPPPAASLRPSSGG
jgi:hypothetical protein